MSSIIGYFLNTFNDYEAIQKKDDDFFIKAIESWVAKYQVDNVNTDKKLELMVEEISIIPLEILTISDVKTIGDIFYGVASKTESYKKMLIDLLRKKPNSRLWLNEVYVAHPIKA